MEQKDEKLFNQINYENSPYQNVPNNLPQQPNNIVHGQPPIIHDFLFIPPPISESSKYLDQLQSQIIDKISKEKATLDYLTILGQKRPFSLESNKLPELLYIDQNLKIKMKKMVKNIHQKMIQNLKYCAGDMPLAYNNPLPRISEKCNQFMTVCQQIKVGQTKTEVLKMMQQQTQIMNEKSEQIQKLLEQMAEYCRLQDSGRARSF